MALIRPNSFVESISGSTCRHDSNYYATNRQTGKTYGIKRCYPSTAPATQAQITHREAFAAKAHVTAQWWAANKPTTDNPNGTEAYQAVKAAYKSQHKIGNLYAFANSKLDAQGNLTITVTPFEGGGTTGGGGTNTNGNEGGGGDTVEGGGM